MKYCEKCRLKVAGERKHCPLCQGELKQLDELSVETFPMVPTVYKKYNFLFRLLIFASIVAGVVSVLVNIMVPSATWWSLFVLAGIGCMWVSMAVAVNKRRNIPKNMLYQVVMLSGFGVLWDAFTGWRGWSIDYVVPIACIAAMLAMSIISRVMNLYLEDYIIYIVIDAFFCVIPVVFLLTGILGVILPSLICVAVSVISMAALFLFEGERLVTELKRRLHI